MNVAGPHEVCPRSAEYYTAEATSDDYFVLWEWDGGGTEPMQATGERVMVTFGDAASDIRVWQVDRRTGCRSDVVVWHTYLFSFDAWPYTQPFNVCEGQSIELNRLPDHPDVPVLYKWYTDRELAHTITVVGDHLERNVQVMANYSIPPVPTVLLHLERRACGVAQIDDVTINIGVIDPPEIADQHYCSHVNSLLDIVSEEAHINADPQQTYWVVDGVGTARGLPAQVVFPHAGQYIVRLHYVSVYGCEVEAVWTVTVEDFPALALEENGGQMCVTGGDGYALTYEWLPTGDGGTCVPYTGGQVSCTVCADNGCCTTLTHRLPDPPCVEEYGRFTVNPVCRNIVEVVLAADVPLPAELTFLCAGDAVGETVTLQTQTTRLLVPERCVDGMRVTWVEGGSNHCDMEAMNPIDSPDWLVFGISGDCQGNIIIDDRSEYVGESPVIEVEAGAGDGVLYAGVLTEGLSFAAFGGSEIEHEFWVRFRIGDEDNCYVELVRNFGPQLQVGDLPTALTLCEYTPALLSADITGCTREVKWTFGDNSYNYGPSLYHTFESGSYHVVLHVEGCDGCQATKEMDVTVEVNDINRTINDNQVGPLCYGAPKVVTYFSSEIPFPTDDNLYYWTPPVTLRNVINEDDTKLFDVYEGGDYRVLEVNPNNGCKGEAAGNVKYPNEVPAHIGCNNTYCAGEEVLAIGYAGMQYSYQWQLEGSDGSPVGASTDGNYRFVVPQDAGCLLTLTVTDNRQCSNSDSKSIVINALPAAPDIYFDGNACITEGGVELAVAQLHPAVAWSNGQSGYTATYYTDGPASVYYTDVNGCRSPQGNVVIPVAPDFGGLLTGCYPMCADGTAQTAVYALGCADGSAWSWHCGDVLRQSGTVPAPPGVIRLNMNGTGVYRMRVDYGQGCKAVSPSLELTPVECSWTPYGPVAQGSPMECTVIKQECMRKGCAVQYIVDLMLTNRTWSTVTVGAIDCAAPMTVSCSPLLPLAVPASGAVTVRLLFVYDFSTPSVVRFAVRDNLGAEIGSFIADLSHSMDCLSPDKCDITVSLVCSINTGQSVAGRVAYYDIVCTVPGGASQILKVWSDGPGEMVTESSGNPYNGLFMISYARLTQMVAAGEDFCFNVLVCKDGDKPCVEQVCKRAEELYEQTGQLTQGGDPPKRAVGRQGSTTRYALLPNPTTGAVAVVDATTGRSAEGLLSVTVLNLLGQTVAHTDGEGAMDLSALPQGSYLVKVVGQKGEVEHLKLVKLQ